MSTGSQQRFRTDSPPFRNTRIAADLARFAESFLNSVVIVRQPKSRRTALLLFNQQDALAAQILLPTFGQMVVGNSFALHEWPENAALSCAGVLERPMLL